MLQHAIAWLQGDDILATTVRTVFVYAFALALVRLGSKRFLSEASAFDMSELLDIRVEDGVQTVRIRLE
jgi:hypothetical protein